MTTVALTGGIGSGKSAVAAFLYSEGIPVFDCDAAAKAVYDEDPALVSRLEERLGLSLCLPDGSFDRKALAELVFASADALAVVEDEVLPVVLEKVNAWKASLDSPLAVIESATILSKPLFDSSYDSAVLVDAPVEMRLERVLARGGISREDALRRIASQSFDPEKIDGTIVNDGTLDELRSRALSLFGHLYGPEFRFCTKKV